jgi:hypothetical protein
LHGVVVLEFGPLSGGSTVAIVESLVLEDGIYPK